MTTRPADLALARVHLRLGCLALARAELETLAGRDELDDAGLVDLAEARWRTGDVAGAGEVALAVLGDGDDGPLVTLVVAAEAALARGRPTEARRYSSKALDGAAGRIDDVFAGMPRGPVWPTDATTLHLPPPTLFDVPAVTLAAAPGVATLADPAGDELAADTEVTASGAADAGEPNTIALWDAAETEPTEQNEQTAQTEPTGPTEPTEPTEPTHPIEPDADVEVGGDAFLSGADALDRGDIAAASIQLALCLRLSPGLASSVLEVIGDRADRELAFVRGDAYRLVGRELDARRAFADAVRPGDAVEPPPDPHHDHGHDDPIDHDHDPEGDPA